MKERGIIMSGGNPKLILEGRKTQTRRVVKSQPNANGFWRHGTTAQCDDCGDHFRRAPKRCQCGCTLFKSVEYPITKCLLDCPYGVAGDRLWVRETHYRYGYWVRNGTSKKTGRQNWRFEIPLTFEALASFSSHPKLKRRTQGWHKRPAIFMPRWASRITLEITGVRVERLQDISEADCLAEGMKMRGCSLAEDAQMLKRDYASIWDSLHGKGAWELNPWVLVLTFSVLKSQNTYDA